MNWVLLTLLSACSMSISRILQRRVLSEPSSNPVAFGFVLQVGVGLLFLLFSLAKQALEFPNISLLWPRLVLMTGLYGIANILIFVAFKTIEAAEGTIILASNTVWSVIAAMLMLNEQINWQQAGGIVLVIAGIIVTNYQQKKLKLSRAHFLALIASVFLGIGFVNDAYIINSYQSLPSYLFVAFAFPGFFSLIYQPKSIKGVPALLQRNKLYATVGAAVFYALAAVTIFTAYRTGGPASIISPMAQVSIIFTVVFAYIFLGERDRLRNKMAGAILAFGGVLLLV